MSPMPSISAIAASKDHSEARTVRILIHSKRTASTKVVLWTGPRTDKLAVVISGGLSGSGGYAIFDGVGSQFHECGFQRGALRSQLIQPEAMAPGQRSNFFRRQAIDTQRSIGHVLADRPAGLQQQRHQVGRM